MSSLSWFGAEFAVVLVVVVVLAAVALTRFRANVKVEGRDTGADGSGISLPN